MTFHAAEEIYIQNSKVSNRGLIVETVDYEIKDHVCYITLNRPEKHNAINYQMCDDLDEAFDRAEVDDEIRVVVLKANGKSFCSGFDLKEGSC